MANIKLKEKGLMAARDKGDNLNLATTDNPRPTMRSRGQSNQPKCHPIHWILPLVACSYVPVLFGLGPLLDKDSFDRYYLFVYSGVLLLLLIPVYIVAVVWLTRRRLKQGNNTIGLTVFQIVSLIPPAIWLLLVLTFGGSPA